MSARRKRKHPIVPQAPKAAAVSAKATQATIAGFHTLLKRRTVLQKQLAAQGQAARHAEMQHELAGVEAEIEGLGGIDAYQHASTLGQSQQRGGDSSKILVEWLKGLRAGQAEPPKLR
jgi:25S rRNA (adenine2142-N1)-methyltransferase